MFAYMNAAASADYASVITLYNWLYNVTRLFTQQGSVPNLSPADIAARKAMNAAAAVELARLSRNLDYFGNVLNWAPVLSVDFYQARVTQLIALGTTISTQLTNFQNQEGHEQLAALTATQSSLQNDLGNIDTSVNALETEIGGAEAAIALLSVQIEQQKSLILSTITADEITELKSASGCTVFENILSGVTAITSFGSAALGGVTSLQSALKLVNAGNSAFQGGESLLQVLDSSSADFASLNTAYNNIATLLQNDPTAAQVAVDQEQFDNLVTTFFEAHAAAVLEEQMQQLITLSQTRNHAVLGVTAQYLKLAGLRAQTAQKSAELNYVSALLAAQNPALPDLIAFMQRAIQDTLSELVDNLWLENQAFSYLFLDPQPFTLQGLDLGSLSTTADSLATNIETYKSANGPFDQFQNEITIDATKFPSAFASLPQTKQLAFAIPLGSVPFGSLFQITVDTVGVGLLGVTPPSGTSTNPTLLTVFVKQCGPDVLRSPASTVFTFTHQPLTTTCQFNYTTGVVTVDGDIGDPSQGYSGLSPFATWLLDFSSADNQWLALSSLIGVTLTFSGRIMSPQSAKRAA